MRRNKLTILTSGPFPTRTKVTKPASPSHISLSLSLLFMKNTIYTKKSVVKQRLFVTYLYVYVYYNISKDNNFKFPKSPNPHSYRGFGNGVELGRTALNWKRGQYV